MLRFAHVAVSKDLFWRALLFGSMRNHEYEWEVSRGGAFGRLCSVRESVNKGEELSMKSWKLIRPAIAGMHQFGFTRLRPGSRFSPIAFGFAPLLCNPPPGPCLGLEIGDEIVMTIEETAPNNLPCDYEALGLTSATELRLSVDDQFENGNGERAYCSISTGRLRAVTGWTYERSSELSELLDSEVYATVVRASNDGCVGHLDLRLRTDGTEDLTTEPTPARISFSYRALQGGAGCPPSCRGGLVGPVFRVR